MRLIGDISLSLTTTITTTTTSTCSSTSSPRFQFKLLLFFRPSVILLLFLFFFFPFVFPPRRKGRVREVPCGALRCRPGGPTTNRIFRQILSAAMLVIPFSRSTTSLLPPVTHRPLLLFSHVARPFYTSFVFHCGSAIVDSFFCSVLR